MKNFPYDEIVEHCKKEYPKEACGLIVENKGRYEYIPCVNVADNPEQEFCIATPDFAKAEDKGEIVVFVHSHPAGTSKPGKTDKESHKRTKTDWLIVGLNDNTHTDFTWMNCVAKEDAPLYGRKYTWHVNDCGSFIRDFYKQEFNINLPDFHRPKNFWENGQEIYLDCYKKAGFHEITFEKLEYGDVILFTLGSSITTHGAVYIGDNKIAHHLRDRLSCKDVLGKYYLDRASKFLRHKDMNNVKRD